MELVIDMVVQLEIPIMPKELKESFEKETYYTNLVKRFKDILEWDHLDIKQKQFIETAIKMDKTDLFNQIYDLEEAKIRERHEEMKSLTIPEGSKSFYNLPNALQIEVKMAVSGRMAWVDAMIEKRENYQIQNTNKLR